jgi:NAD(P)-dependent dehydrogenase (short-subunit alcohol dehydrogenase family)
MGSKVAIITGATRGIGNGLFHALAEQGVGVATTFHADEASAQRFSADALRYGIAHHVERLDVRDFTRLPAFVEAVAARLGRVDYAINNVGYDDWDTIHDITFESWHYCQDIVLNAPFVLSKAVLPLMRRQGYGRIVNIGAASRDYFKGAPGCGAFGIHKAALTVLTRTLALEEAANGITVNMVAPGTTNGAGTLPEEMRVPVASIPIGRRVEVREVVGAILYLLSDAAAAVTGQVLAVNGGLST